MRSKKRLAAKDRHILGKISKKSNHIAYYSHIMSHKTGEDYFAMITARLSVFCLKHLVNAIYKVEPDEIDSQLKMAAMNELTERKVFNKKITPWNMKDLHRVRPRRRPRWSL